MVKKAKCVPFIQPSVTSSYDFKFHTSYSVLHIDYNHGLICKSMAIITGEASRQCVSEYSQLCVAVGKYEVM